MNEEGELLLMPWNLSRNFVNFVGGRGMLEMKGPGDPTGIGEGFSFLKGVRTEEPDVIWEREQRSLSSTRDISYDEIKSKIEEYEMKREEQRHRKKSDKNVRMASLGEEMDGTQFDETCQSLDKKTEIDKKAGQSKYLVITRTINGVEQIEKVFDPMVIRAYLKQRKKVRVEDRKTTKNVLRCGACGLQGHMNHMDKRNDFQVFLFIFTQLFRPKQMSDWLHTISQPSTLHHIICSFIFKACPNFCSRALKSTSTPKKAKNLLTDMINRTIQKCAAMNYASAFLRPVSIKKFPDYLKIVNEPIDLGTMKNKSKNHQYSTFEQFVADLRKMWDNCVKYNGADHGLSCLARKMVDVGEETLKSRSGEIAEIEAVLMKSSDK